MTKDDVSIKYVEGIINKLENYPESFSLERENISTSSSISNKLLTDRLGLEGKEREYIGNSLSLSLEKSYGVSYREKKTIRELTMLSKYSDIIDEMSEQKCFTMAYITALFDRHQSDKTIKILIEIMSKRNVLFVYKYQGKAKSTFGLPVYYTYEATEKDLEDTIRLYESYDDLRYFKEKQRKKHKTSPKEVMEYAYEVKAEAARLREEKLKEGMCCDYKIEHVGGWLMQYHTALCGKGVIKAP